MKKSKRLTTSEVAAEWDRAAPTRERQVTTGIDHSAVHVLCPALLELLANSDRREVLDVGCGTGWMTEKLAAVSSHVVGIDPSAVSLRIARLKHAAPNIRYERSTAEHFAKRHASGFTAAVAGMSLSTCVDLGSVLRSVSCLLRRSGVFVFSIPHPCFFPQYWGYSEKKWFRYLEEVAITARFRIHAEKTSVYTTHFHRPLQRYVNEVVAAGFRIEEFQELRGRGFDLPRFLAMRVRAE